MQIIPIPCLTDNYAYIINDANSQIVGVIDPSEAPPVIAFLKKKNLKLNYILNTHHHFDHIGGNIELKKKYNAKVVGFDGDKHRIPGIDITLKDNEKWTLGNSLIKISVTEDKKNYLFELKEKRKFDHEILNILNKEHYIKKIST